MMTFSAFITGCAGGELTPAERDFVKRARPAGLILFQRNCKTPDQVSALTQDFRAALGVEQALVLIDQEGGRVQRMRPPHWRALPPAMAYAELYHREPEAAASAARAVAKLLASELRGHGITMNCVPVLDIPQPNAHNIIGDRAYGVDLETIVALGRATAEGHLAGGVLPVMKHIPGHGRAMCDSHKELPVIDAELSVLRAEDFVPFRQLADLPAAMTAHVLIPALDRHAPVSLSSAIIEKTIRTEIGFDGLLMSDDLSMNALSGGIAKRAEGVIEAGCDLALHCNGVLREMEQVAGVVPELQGPAWRRYDAALARLSAPALEPSEAKVALEMLERVLTLA